MSAIPCTFVGICLFILGSAGNGLCILVFLRQKFRYRFITPYFIVLLSADSIYLFFRLMKLFYYSQTLFKLQTDTQKSCAKSFLLQAYQHVTQTWPQPFIPFVQSESYMRFSLILMSIMSLQRTNFITRSLKFIVLPATFKDTNKYIWTVLLICSAFLISYLFEFAGLTLFCSKTNNRNVTYDMFAYMSKNMENYTYLLTNALSNRSAQLICVNSAIHALQENGRLTSESNSTCTKEELMDILSGYFDKHQRSTVSLMQKIIFYQTGHPITRNEIRRKYHFHECFFPQEPDFFHRYYHVLYSRLFGLNRHTFLLMFGSIIPSFVTIISNIVSVYRVRELNRIAAMYIYPCRRRTDDTRRILLVITIECLFAVGNSWFGDVVLSFISCKRNFSAGDDCPDYLKKNYDLLVIFDMINSASNIVLHCICGRLFRNELRRMLQTFFHSLTHCCKKFGCCFVRIDCNTTPHKKECIQYSAALGQHESSSSNERNHIHLKMPTSLKLSGASCCDCHWYFNRKPFAKSAQRVSLISNRLFGKAQDRGEIQYRVTSQRTYFTKPYQENSMRLYRPTNQHFSQMNRN